MLAVLPQTAQTQETGLILPTGMVSGAYAVPLPDSLVELVATAHDEAGRPAPGKWHELACMGAGGGLWTTPGGLARFVIEVMRPASSATTAPVGKILSPEMARLMLQPEIEAFGPFCMGLGFLLESDGGTLSIIHGGENQPGFLSLLVALPATGQGVVVMTNGMIGQSLTAELLFAVEQEYDWPAASD